jgi:hypothetical protein
MSPPRSAHRHPRRSSVQKGKGKRKRQSRHPKKRLPHHRRHTQKRHSRSKKRSHQRGGIFPFFPLISQLRDDQEKIKAYARAVYKKK